jgi:DNA-binding CsgD family transcriptional regulator
MSEVGMMSACEARLIEELLTTAVGAGGDQVRLQSALAILRRETAVQPPDVALSPRQQELLLLVVHGYSPAEVAQKMGIQVKTFDTHRTGVFRRLGLRDNVSLAHWAVRHGLLSTEEADEIWARPRPSSKVFGP